MKNILSVVLIVVSVLSVAFGYVQKVNLDKAQVNCSFEKEALEKLAQEQQLQAREFQKMAEQAQQEAIIQRTICEEQIKSLSK